VITLAVALRLTLALLCLWAAAGKLAGAAARRGFARMLRGVGVPPRLVAPVGGALLVAELAVAALAPWPRTGLVGSALAAALFAALTVGVARAVRGGSRVECRCFGGRGGRLGPVHVARNATLTAAAVAALLATAAAPGPPPDPLSVAVAALAAAAAVAVVVRWEDVAAVLRPAPPPSPRKGSP
jgi:hypothetical protein